jgi:hypothetical protein
MNSTLPLPFLLNSSSASPFSHSPTFGDPDAFDTSFYTHEYTNDGDYDLENRESNGLSPIYLSEKLLKMCNRPAII